MTKGFLKKIEQQHPHFTLLCISIIGIFFFFFFLVFSFFIVNKIQIAESIAHFPKFFIVSTIVIMLSSFVIQQAERYFRQEKLQRLYQYLFFTFLLGVVFSVSQALGWRELHESGILMTGPRSRGSYLYIISGLHVLHVLGGMVALIIELYRVNRHIKDPVKKLIFITNLYEKLRIRMLSIYWHFVDVLWVLLLLIFIFSFG